MALVLAAAFPLLFANLGTTTQSAGKWPSYEDVTEKANLHFRHSFGEQKFSSILEATGSGCVWFDYNNDGLLDLYVVSGRFLEGVTNHSKADGLDATNHLYRNNGDGTFTDVTAQAGVAGKGFAMGVTVGDYDNDGYEDMLRHQLGFRRSCITTMATAPSPMSPKRRGVQNNHFGMGAAFVDYDRDGRLDLFVGNYLKFDPNAKRRTTPPMPLPARSTMKAMPTAYSTTMATAPSPMFPTRRAVANPVGRAMGVTVGRLRQRWLARHLRRERRDGKLPLPQQSRRNVHQRCPGYRTWPTAPTATLLPLWDPIFADYDNDGALDLFVSDMRYHRLFRNSAAKRLLQRHHLQSGIAQMSGQYVGWGDGFFDFDNDGWKDVFIVNGGLHWLVPMEPSLFRNNGNGTFTDVSADAGSAFKEKKVGRGGCFADYDNDG